MTAVVEDKRRGGCGSVAAIQIPACGRPRSSGSRGPVIDVQREIHTGRDAGDTQTAAAAAGGIQADVLDAEGDAVGSTGSTGNVLIGEFGEEAADVLLGIIPSLA